MGQRGIVGFASHAPVLSATVARTTGPVLEVGGGVYSTPLINVLAHGRRVVTLESCREWYDRLREYYPTVDAHFCDPPESSPLLDRAWDVVFVDGSARERGPVLNRIGHARFVVVHDTEDGHLHQYPGMAEALDTFRYRKDYKILPFRNQTSVLSNVETLDRFPHW